MRMFLLGGAVLLFGVAQMVGATDSTGVRAPSPHDRPGFTILRSRAPETLSESQPASGLEILSQSPSVVPRVDHREEQLNADGAANDLDGDIDVLTQRHEQIQQQMQRLSESVLPQTPQADDSKGVQGSDSVQTGGAHMQALLANPMAKRFLAAMDDPTLREPASIVITHPGRMTLIYCEIGLFFVMLFVRSWRSARAKSVLGRMWVNFSSLGLHTTLGAVVLPLWIYGPAYGKLLRAVSKVFLG